MIEFRCPNCGRAMVVPDSAGGTVGQCPSCGMVGTVPLPVWTAKPVENVGPNFFETMQDQSPIPDSRFDSKPAVRSKKRRSTFASGCGCLVACLFGGLLVAFLTSVVNDTRKHIAEAEQRASQANPVIPKAPTARYTIIEDEGTQPRVGPSTRRVRVQLDGRITEDEIKAIAHKIKNSDARDFTTTLIFFHLPDKNTELNLPWARASFGFGGPALQVDFFGLSKDDESKILGTPPTPDGIMLGRWIDSSQVYVIYQKAGRFKLDITVKGGGTYTVDLVEKKSALGRMFQDPDEPFDHYVIDSNGDLQIRDESGLIEMARKR